MIFCEFEYFLNDKNIVSINKISMLYCAWQETYVDGKQQPGEAVPQEEVPP